jgi:hypothetical protein
MFWYLPAVVRVLSAVLAGLLNLTAVVMPVPTASRYTEKYLRILLGGLVVYEWLMIEMRA